MNVRHYSLVFGTNTTAHYLNLYKPSSSSTKGLYGLVMNNPMTQIAHQIQSATKSDDSGDKKVL